MCPDLTEQEVAKAQLLQYGRQWRCEQTQPNGKRLGCYSARDGRQRWHSQNVESGVEDEVEWRMKGEGWGGRNSIRRTGTGTGTGTVDLHSQITFCGSKNEQCKEVACKFIGIEHKVEFKVRQLVLEV